MENEASKKQSIFKKWAPLFVLSLALAIIILDTTILNVTLRVIIQDLHTTIQKIQWVITAYSLILAAFTITGGRLGDIFGRKKMFITGAIIFAIGSFITSISTNVGTLITGEAVIEGIGAALMMPATVSLLRSCYKGRELGLAFGIWGGVASASAALGPVIGGWLSTNYSWRWAFRVNIAVVVLLLLGSLLLTEARDDHEKPTIDFGGIALSALGLLSLVFGFIESSTYGWFKAKDTFSFFGHALSFGSLSITPVFVLIGLVILGVFALYENRLTKQGRIPLVSLKLFKNKQFVGAALVTAMLSLGQAGISFSIPVYFQSVLGLDPLHTGIALIPMSIVILIAAPLSAYLSKHIYPKYIVQIGIMINMLGFFIVEQSFHIGATQWTLAPGFIVFGFGMGLIFGQTSNLALSAVPVYEAGEAAGVNNTFRQLGMSLGSAIIGSIMLSSIAGNLSAGVLSSQVIPTGQKSTISQAVAAQTSSIEFGAGLSVPNIKLAPKTTNEITLLSHQATVDANRTALAYAIGVAFLSLLFSTRLPKKPFSADDVDADKPKLLPAHV
jgi:EmrB/QacA subfamily drug resistance transporter